MQHSGKAEPLHTARRLFSRHFPANRKENLQQIPPTNRVDPRAKQLKDHFVAINQSPRSAGQSPLVAHQSLERLTVALHIQPKSLESSPDEQVRQIGKALMLSIFIAEYKKETRDIALLQGLLFFWHSYLDPISSTVPAPSIANVIS